MSSLQSFEQIIVDTTEPAFIMDAIGHQVCEGMKTARWSVPGLGSLCVLHYYEKTRVNIDEEQVVSDEPHYLLHATYRRHDERDGTILVKFFESSGERNGVVTRRVRDEPVERPNGKKAGRPAEIHEDEAKWIVSLVIQAGLQQAEQRKLVVSQPRLQTVPEVG